MKSVDSDHLKGIMKVFFGNFDSKPLSIITQAGYFYD